MWVLVCSKGSSYTLVTGKEHVISRKDGDLVLADDQSISRRHATISVEHDIKSLGDPSKLPVVTITDAASKYGTFLNDGIEKAVKMTNGSSQILKDGDRIRFGLQWNNWRLEHRPLIVTTSTLTPAEKKDLKQHIMLLGGHLVSTWRDDVTHVVMSSLTLTVKVVCALALGRPIVMPEYWSEYIKSLSLKQSLPDCKDHIPPLAESTLNMNEVSFGVNQERKNLFSGKIFVFSSEHQYNSYSCMVNAAGGKAVMLDIFGRRKENLLKPDVIVMQYSLPRNSQDSQIPQAYVDVSRFLRSNGRRTIPESEIGLAILHCSLERNCNPEFSVASTLISNESREIDTQRQVVLALDTQATDSEANKKSGKLIIPESGTVAKPSASNTPLNQKTKTVIPESGSVPKSPVSRTAVNIKLVIPESGSTPKSSSSHIQEQKKLTIPESGTVPDVSDSELSTVPIEKDHDVIVADQSSQFSIGKIKRERISVSDETDAALHPPKRSRKSIEDGFLQKKSSGTKDARACSPFKMEVKEESDNEDLFRFPNDSSVKSSKQESDGEDDRDMFAFTEEPHITQPDFLVNKRRSPLSPCSPPSAESPRKRKNVDMEVEQVRKRPALEKRIPSPIEHSKQVSLNGFISVNSEKKENISTDDTMTDLAEGVKNVTVVEVKPLLSRKCNIETSSFNSSTVNNFKKFRKVQAVTYRPIIKPQDMVPFDVDTKGLNEWLNESHNSEAVHNVVGENDDENDDWAFLQPSDTSALNKTKRR